MYDIFLKLNSFLLISPILSQLSNYGFKIYDGINRDNNLSHLILKIDLNRYYHPYSRYIRLI